MGEGNEMGTRVRLRVNMVKITPYWNEIGFDELERKRFGKFIISNYEIIWQSPMVPWKMVIDAEISNCNLLDLQDCAMLSPEERMLKFYKIKHDLIPEVRFLKKKKLKLLDTK